MHQLFTKKRKSLTVQQKDLNVGVKKTSTPTGKAQNHKQCLLPDPKEMVAGGAAGKLCRLMCVSIYWNGVRIMI